MAEIVLETIIHAPPERVFDLSRSIDFHCKSTSATSEKAIAGVTSGLIGLDEQVTWRARHFFIWQELTVRITLFSRPAHFRDEQVKGAFSKMYHDHIFEPQSDGSTLMRDIFYFQSPLGVLGRAVDALFLVPYFRRFLRSRNEHIKRCAEGDDWQQYI